MIKRVRDITFSWEEGRYFDLWMAVHTLSGVLIGFTFAFFSFGTFAAYFFTIFILIMWEVIERFFFKISETKENRVVDVVVGAIGFAVAYHWSNKVTNDALFSLLIFSAIILLAFTLLGWLDFRRRKLERSDL